MTADDCPRQGRTHIVVVTVRVRHALDRHDALAAVLAGAGEVVGAVVAEGGGEAEREVLSSVHGTLHTDGSHPALRVMGTLNQ